MYYRGDVSQSTNLDTCVGETGKRGKTAIANTRDTCFFGPLLLTTHDYVSSLTLQMLLLDGTIRPAPDRHWHATQGSLNNAVPPWL